LPQSASLLRNDKLCVHWEKAIPDRRNHEKLLVRKLRCRPFWKHASACLTTSPLCACSTANQFSCWSCFASHGFTFQNDPAIRRATTMMRTLGIFGILLQAVQKNYRVDRAMSLNWRLHQMARRIASELKEVSASLAHYLVSNRFLDYASGRLSFERGDEARRGPGRRGRATGPGFFLCSGITIANPDHEAASAISKAALRLGRADPRRLDGEGPRPDLPLRQRPGTRSGSNPIRLLNQ